MSMGTSLQHGCAAYASRNSASSSLARGFFEYAREVIRSTRSTWVFPAASSSWREWSLERSTYSTDSRRKLRGNGLSSSSPGPSRAFLLAVLAFLFLGLMWGFPTGEARNRVAMVYPQTAAARIGLRTGDRIVEINSRRVVRGDDMIRKIHASPGRNLRLVIRRNGQVMHRTAAPAYAISYAGIGWTFYNPREGRVEDAPASETANQIPIRKGDLLISLDGKPVENGTRMIEAIREAGHRPVAAVLERDKRAFQVMLAPYIVAVRFSGVEWLFADPATLKGLSSEKAVAGAADDESRNDSRRALEAAGFRYSDGLLRSTADEYALVATW